MGMGSGYGGGGGGFGGGMQPPSSQPSNRPSSSDPQFFQPVYQPQYQNFSFTNPFAVSQYGQGGGYGGGFGGFGGGYGGYGGYGGPSGPMGGYGGFGGFGGPGGFGGRLPPGITGGPAPQQGGDMMSTMEYRPAGGPAPQRGGDMGLIDITRTDLFPQNQRETLRPAIMSVQNQGGGDFGAFGGFGNIGGVMGFPGSNDPTGGRGFVGPAVPPGTYRSPRGAEYMAEGGIASLMK